MKEKIEYTKLISLWILKDRSKKANKSMIIKEILSIVRYQKRRDEYLKYVGDSSIGK